MPADHCEGGSDDGNTRCSGATERFTERSISGGSSSEGPGPAVGDRSRGRQHHRHRRVHDAGRDGRRGHELHHHARRDRARRGAPGCAVRSAHEAGSQRRGRHVRLRAPRVRRLRRVPHRVVLLDHLLGRQRGDRRVVGAVRRVAVRHQQSSAWTNFGIALTGLWIPAAINLAGVRQMAWFQNLTVDLEVPAVAARGSGRVVLRRLRRTSDRSTRRAEASTTASASRRASRCSRSSESSARRSPPAGSRTRGATSGGHPCTAPQPAACSTSP